MSFLSLSLSLQVNQRQMHKYEQESKKVGKASFAYTLVLDETGKERQRYVGFILGVWLVQSRRKGMCRPCCSSVWVFSPWSPHHEWPWIFQWVNRIPLVELTT